MPGGDSNSAPDYLICKSKFKILLKLQYSMKLYAIITHYSSITYIIVLLCNIIVKFVIC